MSELTISERIKLEFERLTQKNQEYIGYPLTKNFDYQILAPFLNLQINNVGDPFTPSSLGIDTKNIEKEVIGFFSQLLNAPQKDVWGYVTNGGSEGNLYGLYLAREAFPTGMVYYSESTHYSVKKNLHLLNMQNIVIRAQENGEMDYHDLENSITSRRHQPAIFFLNIGSTMKEAIDNLANVKKIIIKLALKNYYIHCDAALLGLIAPFHNPKPLFDFKEGIDSISISGHKFIGSPIPCGIVLCKNAHKDRVGSTISYVDTKDTTITGSRNGLTPLVLWYALKNLGIRGLKNNVIKCIELAKYTEERLNELGVNAWRNNNAITVVFDKPSIELCKKFQLATEESISHIICMPGVEKTQIDLFVDAYNIEIRQKNEQSLLMPEINEEILWPEYF